MLFAYYVHHLSPYLVEFGNGFGVRWYGLAYVAGFLVGILLYKRIAERGLSDLEPKAVPDFIVAGAIFGVVLGGRLGYMLFYDLDGLLANPLAFFRIWEGGMSSHGGIAGLALYTLWYARRHHMSWRNLSDNFVVVAPLGLMFGRLANFINGELYGHPSRVPWAVQFPTELRSSPTEASAAIQAATTINPAWDNVAAIEEAVRHSPELRDRLADILTPRHPSQLYEAVLEGAFLFALLWLLRTRVRMPNGVLTGLFFLVYAIVRIFGEIFRVPDAPLTGPFTRGQFLSLFLVVCGVATILWSMKHPSWPPKWRTR
jgi:phosphatidylglycerol:prolipoprotein diacylglycerol transferase